MAGCARHRGPGLWSLHHQVPRHAAPPPAPRDVAGPFFEPDAPNSYFLAPAEERADPAQAVVLRGRVVGQGRDCPPIPGATVEVWYAGGDSRKAN